jgi:CheY-like chemotaxis protein
MDEVIRILLVEDNEADVDLMLETMEASKILCDIDVVRDGAQAIDYLNKQGEYAEAQKPDLIFLDLNLPKLSGQEILCKIKNNADLKHIPVVVLTSSTAEEDILASYNLHASAYVNKPVDLQGFDKIVHAIDNFWLTVVKYSN